MVQETKLKKNSLNEDEADTFDLRKAYGWCPEEFGVVQLSQMGLDHFVEGLVIGKPTQLLARAGSFEHKSGGSK